MPQSIRSVTLLFLLLAGASDDPAVARSSFTLIDLRTLGGCCSFAYGVNDRGDVVGTSETVSGELHAFLWRAGIMTDLGTLGGTFSRAFALNNRGQIVGESDTASGERHAT